MLGQAHLGGLVHDPLEQMCRCCRLPSGNLSVLRVANDIQLSDGLPHPRRNHRTLRCGISVDAGG